MMKVYTSLCSKCSMTWSELKDTTPWIPMFSKMRLLSINRAFGVASSRYLYYILHYLGFFFHVSPLLLSQVFADQLSLVHAEQCSITNILRNMSSLSDELVWRCACLGRAWVFLQLDRSSARRSIIWAQEAAVQRRSWSSQTRDCVSNNTEFQVGSVGTEFYWGFSGMMVWCAHTWAMTLSF